MQKIQEPKILTPGKSQKSLKNVRRKESQAPKEIKQVLQLRLYLTNIQWAQFKRA